MFITRAVHAPRARALDAATLGPVIDQIQGQRGSQIPIGVAAPACNAAQVVDETIGLGVDFYVADA